jgi:hypothetical protein
MFKVHGESMQRHHFPATVSYHAKAKVENEHVHCAVCIYGSGLAQPWVPGIQKTHRVGRVLSFFSSRRNWDSPTPQPQAILPPTLWYRGQGDTRWRERGWESPNSDEGTYTVVLCIYTYFVVEVN